MEEAYKKAGYTIDDLNETIRTESNGNFPISNYTFTQSENIEKACACGLDVKGQNLVPLFIWQCS